MKVDWVDIKFQYLWRRGNKPHILGNLHRSVDRTISDWKDQLLRESYEYFRNSASGNFPSPDMLSQGLPELPTFHPQYCRLGTKSSVFSNEDDLDRYLEEAISKGGLKHAKGLSIIFQAAAFSQRHDSEVPLNIVLPEDHLPTHPSSPIPKWLNRATKSQVEISSDSNEVAFDPTDNDPPLPSLAQSQLLHAISLLEDGMLGPTPSSAVVTLDPEPTLELDPALTLELDPELTHNLNPELTPDPELNQITSGQFSSYPSSEPHFNTTSFLYSRKHL